MALTNVENKLGQLSPGVVLGGTVMTFLLPVIMVGLFPAQLDTVIEKSTYLVFHNFAEFFSIMVSLAVFSVGWFTFDQSRDRHALFLGTAFLVVGLFDFMHTMSNAAMPAFITPNSTNKSTQFWIAARLLDSSAFLASAFVYPENESRWLTKKSLMTAAIAVTGIAFTLIVFFPSSLPATAVQGVGLTPLKRYLELLVILLLFFAGAAYWKRLARTGSRDLVLYLAAFIICIYSETFFASYKTGFDTYNVLGHIYKVIAFYLIYRGVFISSVNHPYTRLSDAMEKLRLETVSRGELEREIEERKKTEQVLRESETRYRSLFENMINGFAYHRIILDEEGKPADYVFLEVNDAFEKLTGLNGTEIIGKRVTEVLPGIEEDPADWIGAYGRVALTGEVVRFEQLSSPLGVWFSVLAYSPLKGYFVAVFEDITDRKLAEEGLRKAHDDLEIRILERTKELNEAHDMVNAERQRLYGVLETLPVYVVLLTRDYHVPFANHFFRERFGESGGKRCYEYLFSRTEPCENCDSYAVLKTNAPHHWEWTGPDGRNYDIYDYPFIDSDGSSMILEMGIDITERKQAEKALKEINETLEQRITERTADLQAINIKLLDSRRAALNMMEDAVVARSEAEKASAELLVEVAVRKRAEEEIQRHIEELHKNNEELTRFNRFSVGREMRMIELKKEINELCGKAGLPLRYPLDFIEE